MKKVLYGTTALCAAGAMGAGSAAADGIELGLGGYQNVLFSVAAINESSGFPNADFNPTGLWNDGEIWFVGKYKHDNGIEFGYNSQLEINNSPDRIDEAYIFVEGDFGRVVAGSENTAAYIMHYAAPNVGLPINSGWATIFVPNPGVGNLFRRPGGSTYLDSGNDEATLTYYTPRIEGFQLGLSYQPTVFNNGAGFGGSNAGPVEAIKTNGTTSTLQNRNGFAAGVNFVDEFDGFGVAIAGGYRRNNQNDRAASIGFDDYQAVSVGANFSFSGFTIGGSYANAFDGQVTARGSSATSSGGVSSDEGQSWDVGASYSDGPWSIGGSFFVGSSDGSVGTVSGTPGSLSFSAGPQSRGVYRAAQIGMNYALGPGITAQGGVMWVNYVTETTASAASTNTSGIAVAGGLGFSF